MGKSFYLCPIHKKQRNRLDISVVWLIPVSETIIFTICLYSFRGIASVAFATAGGSVIAPEALKNNPLFANIDVTNLKSLLTCLEVSQRKYGKGECIFTLGDKAVQVGVVISGGAMVLMEDMEGQRTILSHVGPGELFGEAFSCAGIDSLPVSVAASEASEVMLFDYRKIVTTCPSACAFHTRMIMNMLRLLAEKNIQLTRKIEHISKRTTREKLLSFLSTEAGLAGSTNVEIPYNRQELADYLCVDRSALSRELGAMQAEKLITYDRKRFTLFPGGRKH